MHTITVTTTTPHGHILTSRGEVTTGTHHDAHHIALDLAAHATIDIHAADPDQTHVHLAEIDGDPHAIITTRTTPSGRTDLLATLRALR